MGIQGKVVPYVFNVAEFRAKASEHRTFGDRIPPAVSWRAGDRSNMGMQAVRVTVLGTQEEAFYCSPDIFFQAAFKAGGDPVFEPSPFACPCTDGFLIIYTLKREFRQNGTDIHSGYILVSREELNEDQELASTWEGSIKPVDAATMLRFMGFGETRPQFLN